MRQDIYDFHTPYVILLKYMLWTTINLHLNKVIISLGRFNQTRSKWIYSFEILIVTKKCCLNWIQCAPSKLNMRKQNNLHSELLVTNSHRPIAFGYNRRFEQSEILIEFLFHCRSLNKRSHFVKFSHVISLMGSLSTEILYNFTVWIT